MFQARIHARVTPDDQQQLKQSGLANPRRERSSSVVICRPHFRLFEVDFGRTSGHLSPSTYLLAKFGCRHGFKRRVSKHRSGMLRLEIAQTLSHQSWPAASQCPFSARRLRNAIRIVKAVVDLQTWLPKTMWSIRAFGTCKRPSYRWMWTICCELAHDNRCSATWSNVRTSDSREYETTYKGLQHKGRCPRGLDSPGGCMTCES
jgi:hypothetical protein